MSAVIVSRPSPGIVVATLNRPSKLNAFNADVYKQLQSCIHEVNESKEDHILIFTGQGKYFSSGADIREIVHPIDGFIPLSRLISQSPKLLIAAVNGPAIGVGVTLATQCDLAFCSKEATFMVPFMRLGLVPEFGSSLLLAHSAGLSLANDMLFTERTLSAEEALRHGLVSRMLPADGFLDAVLKTAQAIMATPLASTAIPIFKRLVKLPTKVALQLSFEAENEQLLARFDRGDPVKAMQLRMERTKAKL